MTRRVVVTGSEGFVGAHVRAALSARGLEVIGVGRPGSGAELELDLAAPDLDVDGALRPLGKLAGVVYVAANIVRTSSVDAAARVNARVVALGALAWQSALSEACPGAPFVYTSSLKAEGSPGPGPLDPTRPPQRPDAWSYGSAKATAERGLSLAARGGATIAIVRPTYVYGPGQHAGNAIPTFLRELWSGRAPTVHGDGAEVRDDVFVGDVAHVLAEALVRRETGAFHAGSGVPSSLWATAEACCRAVEALGGPADLHPTCDLHLARKPWLDRTFDVSRTVALLGLRPTPLAAGLRAEAAWIRAGERPEEAVAAAATALGGPR